MSEIPRTVFECFFFASFMHVGLGYGDKRYDNECRSKDGHTYPQQRSNIGHRRRLGERTDKRTDEKRGESRRERIERATGLYQLVAFVPATAQNIEHRIHDRIQHTHAEPADECTEQIDKEVEAYGKFHRHGNAVLVHTAVHREKNRIGSHDTRQVLHGQTYNAYGHSPQCCFFIPDFYQQVTGRDTHKKVSKEIHHVSHHTQYAIALELMSPYRADGGGQIGYERYHRKDEEHRDDSNNISVLFLLCHGLQIYKISI